MEGQELWANGSQAVASRGQPGGKSPEHLGRLRLTKSHTSGFDPGEFTPSPVSFSGQAASAFGTFEVLTRQVLIENEFIRIKMVSRKLV